MKLNAQIDAIRKKLPSRERRTFPATVELRATDAGPRIAMFIPFNRRSVELWGFTEVIKPGAFRKTLQESDVVALWNHDPSWVLGRQSNDTLEARETDQGLEGEVTLDGQDPMHQHFARRVERRDVQGSSFGFETVRDEWTTEADGTVLRTLVEARLFDLSPVTFPAYPDSDAEKRSSAVDIATVKAGVDIGKLAAVLAAVEDGHIPVTEADEFRRWLRQFEALLPPPPPPVRSDRDRHQRLALRERVVGVRAKRLYTRPTDGKVYETFEACVMDNQEADDPEAYCASIKTSEE